MGSHVGRERVEAGVTTSLSDLANDLRRIGGRLEHPEAHAAADFLVLVESSLGPLRPPCGQPHCENGRTIAPGTYAGDPTAPGA